MSVSDLTSTNVTISWIPPQYPSYSQQQQQQRDDQLTGYTLTYSGVELDINEVRNVYSADTLSVTLTGLEEGIQYTIQLNAFTSAGTGPASSTSVSTLESGRVCVTINNTHVYVYDTFVNTCSTEWRSTESDSCRSEQQRYDCVLEFSSY